MNDLNPIADRFDLEGKTEQIFPFGSGHINDTFKVKTDRKVYLLQRINHHVFKDVEGLTRNLIAVTDYLRRQLVGRQTSMQVLKGIPTRDGRFLLKWEDGTFWRVFDFVAGCHSYDKVSGNDVAREGGRTFGWFVKELTGFPADKLIETIPGFHNAESRIGNFREAVEKDVAGRAGSIRELVDSLLERAGAMTKIHQLGSEGKIPVRVTHNDTKVNNVLFNEHNEGICVIDLDTVMPGYVHFDFGDAIRTFANTSDEDQEDTEKIGFNLPYYEAFARGFLEQTRDILTRTELETLAFSPLYITYEQTVRFLTDYLSGDTYYKTSYPGHNLVRARAQFRLLEQMELAEPAMHQVVQGS